MSDRVVLLNPGPVTLTPRVRQAMLRADMCHREADFARMVLDVKGRLLEVYEGASAYDAVILTGSGTCAVEAMLAAHGKPHEVLRGEWLAPLDLGAVEERLRASDDIARVAAVHHETTTGRLNGVAGLARLCQKYGRGLLLDAVSSFGGEDIRFEEWGLEAVAATANKCLHAVPGMAFVVAHRAALEDADGSTRSVYLDLRRYYAEQRAGFSPFTQSVQACFALHEALLEMQETGGWVRRQARYRLISDAVRDRLGALGAAPLIPWSEASSMLSAFRLPDGLPYEVLHDTLRAAGFVIYAGQGALAGSIFRIATMGDIRDDDLDRLLASLVGVFRAVRR